MQVNPPSEAVAIRRIDPGDSVKLASGAAILALVGAGLAMAALRYPPPSLGLILAGGTALICVLMLAISRYDIAVALGFVLLGIETTDPAPPDLVFAIVIAVAAVTGRFDATRVPLTIFGTLGALLVLNLISMIGAVDPVRAGFFFMITLYLAVFSIWLTGYLNSQRRARLIVIAYLATAVISALLGVLSDLGYIPWQHELLYNDRAKGLFVDSNVFGPFMVPIMLIMIEETLRPRLVHLRRLLKVAIIFLFAIAILFSYSRAAWLNAVFSIVVFFGVLSLRSGGSRQLVPLLLILLTVAVAGSFLVSASGSTSFLTERATLQSYDAERFAAQETGIKLASQHPLGIGPGQYERLTPISAHETYIRVFAEQGVLGLVALTGLMLSTLVLALRNAALGRSTYGIGSAALLAAWSGLIINGLFVDTLHWRYLWIVAPLIWAGALRGAGANRRVRGGPT